MKANSPLDYSSLRPVAVLIAVGAAVAFANYLYVLGLVPTSYERYKSLLLVWGVGLFVLIVLPTIVRQYRRTGSEKVDDWTKKWVGWLSDDLVVFSRACWCGFGAIAIGLLIPHTERFMLLVIPVFCVFYAALHLSTREVGIVAGLSWLSYLGLLFVRQGWQLDHPQFELLSFTAFGAFLLGGLFMAHEMLLVRDALRSRNLELNALLSKVQDIASKDELTGLFNRRFIMENLERQKALTDRGHPPFVLCFCDLDHFKSINDRFGHVTGDAVLAEFAELAQSVVRSVDYVARIGGEEFLLVLVGADEFSAQRVVRRLSEGTRKICPVPGKTSMGLSVSMGIAQYKSRESIDEIMRRADSALYEAKHAGRDRAVFSR